MFQLHLHPSILLLLIAFIDILSVARSSFATVPILSNIFSKKTSNDNPKAKKQSYLPKLTPHEDNCYLMEFHHDDCDHANQMEPVLKRLEEDLDTKVRRINVSRRKEFFQLLNACGHDECGQFPFYYNRRTGQAVCGATSYKNLRCLGQGEIGHMFHEPPDNIHDREGRGQRKTEVGFKGFMADKIAGIGGNNQKKSAGKANKKPSAAVKDNKDVKKDNVSSKGNTVKTNKGVELHPGKQQKPSSSASDSKTAAERLQERKNARTLKKQQRELVAAGSGR